MNITRLPNPVAVNTFVDTGIQNAATFGIKFKTVNAKGDSNWDNSYKK